MIALLFFLGSFCFYLRGASPVLDGGDSGEFITASVTLGVSHAPGYPTLALLLKPVQLLVPFASAAYRAHVFSAVVAALLLLAVYFFLKNLFRSNDTLPAFLTTVFLGTRPLFVEQARVVEAFGLNALFFLLILLALQRRQILVAWFLFGLGLGNHHTLLAAVPFLVAQQRVEEKSNSWFLSAGVGLLGLSVYLYLPLRALVNPPVNFGDPETWGRFWAVVTRKEFGSLSLHPSAVPFRDGALVLAQFKEFVGRILTQAGPAVMVSVAGLVAGCFIGVSQRRFALACLVGWLGVGFGFEWLSNLSPGSDIGQWRLERFYLVPLLFSSGLVFLWLRWTVGQSGVVRIVSILITGVLLGLPIAQSWSGHNYRWNLVYRDFALSALRSAPLGSRLVIDRLLFDEPTSALLVATLVEKKRPDIKFFYRPGTLFGARYGDDVLALSWEQRLERQRRVEAVEILNSTDPVRALAFEKINTPFQKPVLDGLLYADSSSVKNERRALLVNRSALTGKDYPSRLVQAHFPYFRGKAAVDAGKMDLAHKWFGLALEQSGGMTWLLCNIGSLYAQANDIPAALDCYETAVKQDPYFYDAQYGLGYTALNRDEFDRAITAFETAVRLDPTRAEGHYMRGVAYSLAGRGAEAKPSWRRYLELEPHGKMADTVRNELRILK